MRANRSGALALRGGDQTFGRVRLEEDIGEFRDQTSRFTTINAGCEYPRYHGSMAYSHSRPFQRPEMRHHKRGSTVSLRAPRSAAFAAAVSIMGRISSIFSATR